MQGGEVDTGVLVSEILRAGKTLYVPRIERTTPSHMELLQIRDLDDLQSLPSGTWGIKEPGLEWNGGKRRPNALDEGCDGLELILVPGVAFDHSLSRLGHGKGYYDRFISSYTAQRQRPLLVALALRQQIIDGEVPIGSHDWKMDLVVGPDGIIGVDPAVEDKQGGKE
jgi:5-formyltetrahydrofolate cyclo-ligase